MSRRSTSSDSRVDGSGEENGARPRTTRRPRCAAARTQRKQASANLRPVEPADLQPQSRVGVNGSVQQQRFLKNARHPPPHDERVGAVRAIAAKMDRARARRLEQGPDAQQGRFSRAVRSDKCERLAVEYLQPGDLEDRRPPVPDHDIGERQEGFGHRVSCRCWMCVRMKLIAKLSASRMRLSAMARSKLPLAVSSTVAVVSTRVWPRMLPPTIIDAPTSEMMPPKPAMTAARSGSRASLHKSHSVCARDAPIPASWRPRFGFSVWKLVSVRPATIGKAITTCAMMIAVGV